MVAGVEDYTQDGSPLPLLGVLRWRKDFIGCFNQEDEYAYLHLPQVLSDGVTSFYMCEI